MGRPRYSRKPIGRRDALNPVTSPTKLSYTNQKQHEYQSETMQAARNTQKRWTPEEDDVALFGEGRLVDRALQLGRTYNSVKDRITKLYSWLDESGKTIVYPPEEFAPPVKKLGPVLCPCGSVDGEHDSWCPEAAS